MLATLNAGSKAVPRAGRAQGGSDSDVDGGKTVKGIVFGAQDVAVDTGKQHLIAADVDGVGEDVRQIARSATGRTSLQPRQRTSY
jgi:hypothetical protein